MFTHATNVRVRYGETDQMGFVYYGAYALYYEVGRVEAIRSLGITYRQLEDEGIIMPVVRLTSKYVQPARYDDLLDITSVIREMPDRLISFHVTIKNQADQLINRAEVVLCFRNMHTGQLIRTPSIIQQRLANYFD
ncbi:MAG: acyl-CoA thioesterase [Saprospiraceae bacterium]|nr:acyl-CoA thioesterase [Saprospiraceae bacterium]